VLATDTSLTANAGLGPLPGWLVILGVTGFYLWLLRASLRQADDAGEGSLSKVHV